MSLTLLVINSGSSSLKYRVLSLPGETLLSAGLITHIGEARNASSHTWSMPDGRQCRRPAACPDHASAMDRMFDTLAHAEDGCLRALSDIDATGHRVVHGRDRFTAPARITPETLAHIRSLSELAPLHQPLNAACIAACMDRLPDIAHVAVFDTAFFRDMPAFARMYAVPPAWAEQYGVYRYGFHGISYGYVTAEAARLLESPLTSLKMIAAHLGNGASITAVDRGRVLDTSMGFTPLEGLMMGTRSGNFDPAIVPYLMEKTGKSHADIIHLLNTRSGLLAVSGTGRDMRQIVAAAAAGDHRARLAFDMFIHRLRKYIGGYAFAMGGVDAIVFTGGIGENSPEVRAAALQGLSGMGIGVDKDRNEAVTGGRGGVISGAGDRVRALVVPTNEELMIAREVYGVITERD